MRSGSLVPKRFYQRSSFAILPAAVVTIPTAIAAVIITAMIITAPVIVTIVPVIRIAEPEPDYRRTDNY